MTVDLPCQCHRSNAAILPTHAGHCCFFPADQDCHPAEVRESTERFLRWHGPNAADPADAEVPR